MTVVVGLLHGATFQSNLTLVHTSMLAAMKTNYEGNCQESRFEAHGGNIY